MDLFFYRLDFSMSNSLKDELIFLSLNQFVKCKSSENNGNGLGNGLKICFFDFKVIKLKDKLPLSYNDSIHLIYYLQLQQSFLERKGYGFCSIGIEDVIVLEKDFGNDELVFACITSLNLNKINEKGDIVFMSPFSRKGRFCSPEILALNSIPSSVSHKCFYFSLGALCLYCLGMDLHTDITIIKGTKLYCLIERIMNDDPKKRILLMT